MSVHVIAEAGTNHGGRLETALRLADIAASAGADSVKYQIIYPEGLYLPALVQDGKRTDNEVYRKRQAMLLPDDAYPKLAEHCRAKKVPFSASIFDRRGLDLLDALDPPYLKIASCDLNHSALLKAAAERGRTLVVSTGMSTLAEIERAVKDVTAVGRARLVLLHCVSVYPCPVERMNLPFLQTLRREFGLPVGLSDHTEGELASTLAVAMGAEWLEKHFTYDRKAEGFDHAYAMEPAALADYVRAVRRAEEACRARDPKVGEAEATVRKRARRSLYAARDLAAGQAIREADVLVVRPEGPFAPGDLAGLLGKRLRKPLKQYEALSPEVLE
jgi:sialic acid synthase SpsE